MDCSMPGFQVLHHLPNSCPLSWWCHSSSSHLCCLLLLLPSIFPIIRVFSSESALCIRWPDIGASGSVLPVNDKGWFSSGLIGLTSLLFKGVFSSTTVRGHQFFRVPPFLLSSSHICTTTGKTIALTEWTFVWKVMSLLFNMLLGLSLPFFQGASVF